jgi:repressor LexA
MPAALNDLEQRILDYMVRYLRTRTYQPSIREIGEEFGIRSTKTVSEHLRALADKGYLERDPSRSRGVRMLGVDLNPDTVSLPCYGSLPDPAATRRTDGAESYLTLDRRMAGPSGSYFVRVRDEKTAPAGIQEGDLILIEPVERDGIREGDLLAVNLDGRQELHRFSRRGQTAFLTPAGGGAPLALERLSDLKVSGRVAALHRRLDGVGVTAGGRAH